MKVNFTEEKERNVNDEINGFFKKVSLFECKICHNLFVIDDQSQCITHGHKGKRVPFSSGEMEEYDVDEIGNPVVFVKYSCCGEKEINEDGCDLENPIDHKNHIADEERVFSTLSVSEMKLFR